MIVQVPLASLRLPGIYPGATGPDGKEGKDITPEMNDPVSFSVEGIVSAISGQTADVEIRLINGGRPGQADAESGLAKTRGQKSKPQRTQTSQSTSDPTEAEMETAAREADEEEYI
jgi:hypothetical protein